MTPRSRCLIKKPMDKIIYSSRWILYPVNIGLLLALLIYVGHFIYDDYKFLLHALDVEMDLESLMVHLLGFVDAAMVANLVIMIVQGGHQIFISKFHTKGDGGPQYLDHIDTGILKVKMAMSISSITLIQLLEDFANLAKIDWQSVQHKIIIHGVTLVSALTMAIIWRVLHPSQAGESHEKI